MNFNSKSISYIAIGVVIILVLGIGGYVYFKSSAQVKRASTAQPAVPLDQNKALVIEVGKLMELPTDENPQIATVADITKLSSQPFFKKAKNGDKVLIYATARKAILYDPDTKKILDVAPINTGTPSASPKPK